MAKVSPARRWPRSLAGGWLAPDALVVVEEAAKAEIAAPSPLEPIDARIYGDTQIAIFAMPGGGLARCRAPPACWR